MFRLRVLGAAALIISACDAPVTTHDGGADASFDGGADAGSRDAGRDAYRPPVDAGPQWTEGDPPEVAWVLPDCVVAHGVLAREAQTTRDNGYANLHGFDVRDGRATIASWTRTGIVWQTVSPTAVIDEIVPEGISSPKAVVIHEGTSRLLASLRRPDRDFETVISSIGTDPREIFPIADGGLTIYSTLDSQGRIESAGPHIEIIGELVGPSVPNDALVSWLTIDGDGAQVGTARQIASRTTGVDPVVLFDPAQRRGVVIDQTWSGENRLFVTPFTETTVAPRRAVIDETMGQSAPVGLIVGDVVAIVYHGDLHPDAFYPLEYYTEVSVTTGEVLVAPRRWYERDRGPYPLLRFVSRPDGRVDMLRQEHYSALERGVYNSSQPLTIDLGLSLPIEASESEPSSIRIGGGGEVRAVLAERDGEDLFVFWHEVGPCMAGDFEDEVDRPCVSSALWAILRCDE